MTIREWFPGVSLTLPQHEIVVYRTFWEVAFSSDSLDSRQIDFFYSLNAKGHRSAAFCASGGPTCCASESISIAPNGKPQCRHLSRKGKLLVLLREYGLLHRGQGHNDVQRTPRQKRKIETMNNVSPIENIIEGGYFFRMIPSIGSIATHGKEINATARKKRNNLQPRFIFVCLFKFIP